MPGAASAMPALPAGFRFHPTDEELIVHYLMNQAAAVACPVPIIAEVNIYQCNPWDLPAKAVFGEKEWYFFSPRDRKYPNGGRPNRAAGSGYWKATGTDKAIVSTPASRSIGVKKALVFYRGKPPKGVKTDWIMHEYRLTPATTNATTKRRRPGPSPSMRLDDWVLCRIYKKSNDFFQLQLSSQHKQEGSTMLEEASLTNAAMNNSSNASSSSPESELAPPDPAMAMAIPKSCSLTDLLATIDYSTLSHLLLDGSPDTPAPAPASPLIYAPPPCETLSYSSSHISDACLDYGVNYSGLKRFPVATDTDSEYSTDRSFEDGSGFAKKMQLPSDSKVDSYCVQRFADESGFQYSSLLASHLLLNQQQLLSNHLQMQ